MTVLRPQGLDAFLRKPDPAGALLIHGDDGEGVREMASRAVRRIAGTLDDPFAVTTLADHDLGSDPARLADEVQSMSMFGGRKAIWVRNAGEGFLKAVMPVLEGRISGNFVVAEAGALSKSSQLRTRFEKSPHGAILPLYEAEAGEIAALAEQILARDGLEIGPDALGRFVELAGSARGLVRQEAEKLALYAQGMKRVGIAEVEAVCGNDTGATPDELADAVFGGEVSETDRLFRAMVQGGTDAGRLLGIVHGHALRLQDFRIAVERGMPSDQAVRSARPPVFFKRQSRVLAQIRVWSLADLVTASATLGANVLSVRQNAGLAEAIANRCLLSLARQGLKLRQDG